MWQDLFTYYRFHKSPLSGSLRELLNLVTLIVARCQIILSNRKPFRGVEMITIKSFPGPATGSTMVILETPIFTQLTNSCIGQRHVALKNTQDRVFWLSTRQKSS